MLDQVADGFPYIGGKQGRVPFKGTIEVPGLMKIWFRRTMCFWDQMEPPPAPRSK
jgi:hypothetical protein